VPENGTINRFGDAIHPRQAVVLRFPGDGAGAAMHRTTRMRTVSQ
jgi:hypothetical protein